MASYTTTVNVASVAPGNVLIPQGITHITIDLSAADTAAITAIATAAAMGAVAGKQDSDGSFVLPVPTGTAADDAVIQAAILSGRKIVARVGTYGVTSHIVIPDGTDLIGQGGGSASRAGRTVFKCLASAAQIEIQGGGGTTGGFEIDGNSTALTPLARTGGAGANARSFFNITTHSNAPGGAVNDLVHFYAAQNDYWEQCGFGYADRDVAWFDAGYGGATFNRCEWTGSIGRYTWRFDNQVTVVGQQYPQPANIVFIGTNIGEGSVGTSHVKLNAGQDIVFDKTWFFTLNPSSGPAIDISPNVGVSVVGIVLIDPRFQSSPSTKTAGTKAISLKGNSDLTMIGSVWYFNYDKPINIDGVAAKLEDKTYASFFNCSAPHFTGTSGATRFQWENLSAGAFATVPDADTSPASGVMTGYNAARTALQYQMLADGTMAYYPGTGFGGFDATWGRIAAGVIGPKPGGGQMFLTATGGGTTAQRTTPPAGVIALYGNTQTNALEWWNGSVWQGTGSGGGGGGSSATAPRDLPGYAPGSALHVWDPGNSFYYNNSDTLHGWRAAVDRFYAGISDLHLACVGDSVLGGYNGTSYFYEDSVIRTLGKQIAKSVGASFCNGIQMAAADTTASPGKVYDNVTRGTFVANTQYLGSTGSGQTCSFVTLDPATTIDIFYYDGIGSGTLGVTIDGVAQTGITIGSTNTVKKATYPGLANTVHTVAFTSTAANQLLLAWWWRNPSVKQVYSHGLSIGGSCANTSPAGPGAAANWSSLSSSAPFGAGFIMNAILTAAGVTPDASAVSLGGNDITQGTSPTTIDTGLANVFGYSWLGSTKTFLKIYKPLDATSDTTFDTWSGLCFTRCDSSVVSMFDIDHFVHRRVSALADNLLGNDSGFHTHPLRELQMAIGRMAAKLLSVGLQAAPFVQMRIETTGASASYVPRYSVAVSPAGYSPTSGKDQPPDWIDGDSWDDLP